VCVCVYDHLPYSPDLFLRNYLLFLKLNIPLKETRFENVETIESAIYKNRPS